ncbi:MAG: A/G-specific adenine glycosylase [Clostridia bacterium]|nr:A/G-specific adenine glycosylase [Clostridia bacterium]
MINLNFQDNLLKWYEINKRLLPWRETQDPYKIWVSEIMLQQTQVKTVIDYYNRFIKVFPNVEALSKATEDEMHRLWQGLGYYSRADKMMLCAKEVVKNHEGQFPKDHKDMLSLPGIGPYTAGAVLSIAYNMPFPAVDGNVMRVISRQFNIQEDISIPRTRKVFEEKVQSILPKDVRHFNQALMELGALICTPKNPKCEICPVVNSCVGYKAKNVELLPIKTKKTKKTNHIMAVAYVKCEDQIMITKRPNQGILANLWGFPIIEVHSKDEALKEMVNELQEIYGLEVEYIAEKNQAKHIFTHRIWEMQFFEFKGKNKVMIDFPNVKWLPEDEIKDFHFPTAFKKLVSN